MFLLPSRTLVALRDQGIVKLRCKALWFHSEGLGGSTSSYSAADPHFMIAKFADAFWRVWDRRRRVEFLMGLAARRGC